MHQCPKEGCDILIPPDRAYCTKHWHELRWQEQWAWMHQLGNDTEYSE